MRSIVVAFAILLSAMPLVAVPACDAVITARVPLEAPHHGATLFTASTAGGDCYGYNYAIAQWHESQPEPQINLPAIVFNPNNVRHDANGEVATGIGHCNTWEGVWNLKIKSNCYRVENGQCVIAPEGEGRAAYTIVRRAAVTELEIGRDPQFVFPIEYGYLFQGIFHIGSWGNQFQVQRGIKLRFLPTDTYPGSSYANPSTGDWIANNQPYAMHGAGAEFLEATPHYCGVHLAPTIAAVPIGDDECCDCNGNRIRRMPNTCFGAPIRASNGNMRMNDRDPLPQVDALSIQRTYDSNRFWKQGWFGRGWHSVFDAWTREAGDGAGHKTIVVATPDNARFVFWGGATATSFTQVWPKGNDPASLIHDTATDEYRLRPPDSDVELIYRRSDQKLVRQRDLSTGREIVITYTNGAPSRVQDSWGNWAWVVSADGPAHRITSITVEGTPLTVSYAYTDNHLTSVTGGGGTWRTYQYASVGFNDSRLSAAYDGAGALIESHSYASNGAATSSIGNGLDYPTVTHDVAGRVPKERATIAVLASGATTTYYTRQIAGRERTVEVVGGCTSCSSGGDAVYAYNDLGELTREQDARGYVMKYTYHAGGRTASLSGPWRPSGCDPETDPARCRLSVETLSDPATTFDSTTATLTTTYAYGDANWPNKTTSVTSASVRNAGQNRVESFTYDAATGRTLTHAVTGWTGSPAVQQTLTTTTTLNDGVAGAPFAPLGAFLQSWVALAQPKGMVRLVDGPRSDVSDLVDSIWYPIHADVPALLRGHLAATRNAMGHIVRYEDYDVFGNARRIVDANGVVTEQTFDAVGRLLTSTIKGIAGCDTAADPLCATDIVTSRTYKSVTGPLEIEQHADGVTKYTYDARGRVKTISRGPAANDLKEQVDYVYNATTGLKTAERLLAYENGAWVLKSETSFTYDGEGRVTFTTRGTETEQNSYGAGGLLAATRDARHTVFNTEYSYDSAGRLTSVQQLSNALTDTWIETTYGYDIAGNLTAVRDPNGNDTTYLYDDFGQMIRQTSPVTGVTTYVYDPAGNLLSTTDANGSTTTRTYDAIARAVTATSTRTGATSETVSWTYDEANSGHATGRLTTMTDPTGTTKYRYERRGLLIREEKTFSGAVSAPHTWTYVTSYEYDREGSRAKIRYPSGQVVTYTHDYAGRPLTAAPFVTGASYLPFGPQTEVVYGNGTTRTMQYDNKYRIKKNKLTGPAGTLAEYEYDYEAGGNITGITDLADAGYSRTFAYDDLNRLVTADTGSSLWGTGGYSYDAMGNVLALTIGTASTVGHRTATFAYSGTTPKVSSVIENGAGRALQYDAAGNETAYNLTRGYSTRNLLAYVDRAFPVQPTAAHRISYAYDGRGVRVVRTEGNPGAAASLTSRRFYVYTPELQLLMMTAWDRPNPFKSTSWANLIESEYVWFHGAPVAQTAPFALPPPRYTFPDHLGTPLIQTDPSGTVVWRAEHEPYGNIFLMRTGTREEQPLRLPGQEAAMSYEGAEESYNVFRWYRGGWGRYTQADPLAPGGIGILRQSGHDFHFDRWTAESVNYDLTRIMIGGSNAAFKAQPFTYAASNPLLFADPLGLVILACLVEKQSATPRIVRGPGGVGYTSVCLYSGFCKGSDGNDWIAKDVELHETPPCKRCKDVCFYRRDTATNTMTVLWCKNKRWRFWAD